MQDLRIEFPCSMSLSKKVKVGLDETRILILGSQILLGFEFQTVFRPAFDNLPAHDHVIEIASLALITLTVGLIISPSVQHRIVEDGEDTPRILRIIRSYASWSLAHLPWRLGPICSWWRSESLG